MALPNEMPLKRPWARVQKLWGYRHARRPDGLCLYGGHSHRSARH